MAQRPFENFDNAGFCLALSADDAGEKMFNKTDSPPTSPAKVFAIPELLEQILNQIAKQVVLVGQQYSKGSHGQQIKDLIRLQRVNKSFLHAIKKSKNCRRALFFEHTYSGRDQEKRFARFNPLIFDILPLIDLSHGIHIKGNELIYSLYRPRTHQTGFTYNKHQETALLNLPGRGDGSWKEALICNMPAKIEFLLFVDGMLMTSMRTDRFRPVSTLGQMVELFEVEIGNRLRLLESEMKMLRDET